MIVSINQPAYFPWLGYFERIAASDLHIVLDHVQFEKNSFTNRNKVRTKDGWTWLSVPVLSKGKFGDLSIETVEVDPHPKWRKKHFTTLKQSYGKAPYWKQLESFLEDFFAKDWTSLAALNAEMTVFLLKELGIHTTLQRSSDLQSRSTKSDLVLDLCREVGASVYLSGAMGADYLQEDSFAAAGIEVRYQAYKHPEYDQLHPGPFEAYMGAIDLLANTGPDAKDIMLSGSHYRTGAT